MKLRKKEVSEEKNSTDIFKLVFRTLHPEVSFGTVFLLEPDDQIRSFLKRAFDLHNITCSDFSSGEELIKGLDFFPFPILRDKRVGYVIILDITSNETNGYELCKMIKLNPELKDLPVFFIVSEFSEIEKHLEETKANNYIIKPFHFKDLLHIIAKYLYKEDSYYYQIIGMEE